MGLFWVCVFVDCFVLPINITWAPLFYLTAAADSRSSWLHFPVLSLIPRTSLITLPEIPAPHGCPMSPLQGSEFQLSTCSAHSQSTETVLDRHWPFGHSDSRHSVTRPPVGPQVLGRIFSIFPTRGQLGRRGSWEVFKGQDSRWWSLTSAASPWSI